MILGKSYYGNIATDKIYLGSNLIYQLTPPTPFEDYYNLVVDFGTNNHVTFDQQPTWGTNPPTDDFVHPSVLYFENGWNGHNYWMYITGYADTQGVTENPYLFYSDDEGYTWQTLVGTPAPIHTYNSDGVTDTAHLSDTWVMMEGSTMHLFNRGNLNAGGTYWEYRSTTDGVNFTARQRITFSGVAASTDYVSASFILIDGTWYMFGTDSSSQEELAVLTSTSLSGTWTEINRIASDSGALWHTEVRYNPDDTNFYVLGSTGFISGGNLMFGKFSDVMATTMETRNTFLIPRNDQTWNAAYYKSSFIIKDNAMELFLGCKGERVDSNTDWRVQKATTYRLSPTLDLTPYTLTESYPLADVANGFSNGTKTTYSNKMVIQATVVDPLTFRLDINRLNTTSYCSLYILSNTLYFERWGGIRTFDFNGYGIKVDDVVTLIRDETKVECYINSNLIYTYNLPDGDYGLITDQEKWLGTNYGPYGQDSSIKDLKVYKKPEWIIDETAYFANIDNKVAEAQLIPAKYLLVDDFERAALGTTDLNGTTYTLVTTANGPQIISNSILRVRDGILGVPVSTTTHYRIYIKGNARAPIILNYTDVNNLRYLEYQEVGNLGWSVKKVDAGVTTTELFIDVENNISANFNLHNFEINGSQITVFMGDTVVNTATLPANANPLFIGSNGNYQQIESIVVEDLTFPQ
jgi:hypothetical protein